MDGFTDVSLAFLSCNKGAIEAYCRCAAMLLAVSIGRCLVALFGVKAPIRTSWKTTPPANSLHLENEKINKH
jgi:hypothetical protein